MENRADELIWDILILSSLCYGEPGFPVWKKEYHGISNTYLKKKKARKKNLKKIHQNISGCFWEM